MLLHRLSDFDQIPVGIVESNDTLSPAVRHGQVDKLGLRIKSFQLFIKSIHVFFLKIQLAGVVFGNNVLADEPAPEFFFLQE